MDIDVWGRRVRIVELFVVKYKLIPFNGRVSTVGENSELVFKEYMAGASLAFGLVLLTFQALNAYYNYMGVGLEGLAGYADEFFTLFLGLHISGGALGGYLVCRRREEKTLKAGVVTALIAYVIEYIYYLIFEGAFPGSFWALLSFIGGGVVGALFASVRHAGRLLTSLPIKKRDEKPEEV